MSFATPYVLKSRNGKGREMGRGWGSPGPGERGIRKTTALVDPRWNWSRERTERKGLLRSVRFVGPRGKTVSPLGL